MMNNNRRDCFNNRSKSQSTLLSRADRAATWRGRGDNNSLLFNRNDRKNNNHIVSVKNENFEEFDMDYKFEREAKWNGIPNPNHTPQDIIPLIDNSSSGNTLVDFQVKPNYQLRSQLRAPPGITPLCDIPCIPLSNNKWSSSFRTERLEPPITTMLHHMHLQQEPLQQQQRMFGNVVDENYKFSPQSSYDAKENYLLCQGPKKEYEYSVYQNNILARQQHQKNWVPLQSIENNRNLDNLNVQNNLSSNNDSIVCGSICQHECTAITGKSSSARNSNKENLENPPIVPTSSCTSSSSFKALRSLSSYNNRAVGPPSRSWSQVVSNRSSSSRRSSKSSQYTTRNNNNQLPSTKSISSTKNFTNNTVDDTDTVSTSNDKLSSTQSSITIHENDFFSSPLAINNHQSQLPSTCKNVAISISPEAHSSAHTTRYISESLGFMMSPHVTFSDFPEQRPFTVLRITNIPWSISSDDIRNLINHNRFIAIPGISALPQSVHFIMDPKTGKTLGEAYVEIKMLRNKDLLSTVIYQLSNHPVQGRHLRFTLSNYDELHNHLFPHWRGKFENGIATTYQDEDMEHQNRSFATEGELFFIGQRELQGLLNVCRNYKVFYNRKCPERPFEYLMSITVNIPWLQNRCVSTIQRDILYECYKLVTESLRIHMSKAFHSFDSKLLIRLIRTALACDGFTVKQKQVILNNSKLECPTDLAEFLEVRELPSPKPVVLGCFIQSTDN